MGPAFSLAGGSGEEQVHVQPGEEQSGPLKQVTVSLGNALPLADPLADGRSHMVSPQQHGQRFLLDGQQHPGRPYVSW